MQFLQKRGSKIAGMLNVVVLDIGGIVTGSIRRLKSRKQKKGVEARGSCRAANMQSGKCPSFLDSFWVCFGLVRVTGEG